MTDPVQDDFVLPELFSRAIVENGVHGDVLLDDEAPPEAPAKPDAAPPAPDAKKPA